MRNFFIKVLQIAKRKTIKIVILSVGISTLIVSSSLLLQKNFKKEKISCVDCNIIFVSFDTLSARHVSALGYKRRTTPTLDRLAQNGFVFTNAISVSSWTLPSTMSWFTSVYPSQHKVTNKYTVVYKNDDIFIPSLNEVKVGEKVTNLKDVSPNLKTLSWVLKESGYKTGAFTGGAGVDHQFGFDQGFEIYEDRVNFGGFKNSIPKAIEWISENKENKLFVFLHGYDAHNQYVPEEGYDYRFVDFKYKGRLTGSREEFKEFHEQGLKQGKIFLTPDDVRFLIALYDERIQKADEKFAQFLSEYQNLGLARKTLFIITSDHGEELYEHGTVGHGHTLYDELIHVPLIIAVPGTRKEKKITEQVRSIDIMPTILDLIGIKPSESLLKQMKGTSLSSLMTGEKKYLDVFPETDYRYAVSQRAIRTPDQFKFTINLDTKVKELYNLNSDSWEKNNLIYNESKKKRPVEVENLLLKHLRDIQRQNE